MRWASLAHGRARDEREVQGEVQGEVRGGVGQGHAAWHACSGSWRRRQRGEAEER